MNLSTVVRVVYFVFFIHQAEAIKDRNKMIILSLVQSSKQFNGIQHELTGISAKVLAKELKDLELNDLL